MFETKFIDRTDGFILDIALNRMKNWKIWRNGFGNFCYIFKLQDIATQLNTEMWFLVPFCSINFWYAVWIRMESSNRTNVNCTVQKNHMHTWEWSLNNQKLKRPNCDCKRVDEKGEMKNIHTHNTLTHIHTWILYIRAIKGRTVQKAKSEIFLKDYDYTK